MRTWVVHPTESQWQALLDGEVREPLRGELERHLVACEACTKRFTMLAVSLAVTEHALDSLDGLPQALDVERVVHLARKGSINRTRLSAVASALLFVTVVGTMLVSHARCATRSYGGYSTRVFKEEAMLAGQYQPIIGAVTAAAALALSACDSTGPRVTQPVDIKVAAHSASLGGSTTAGPLAITGLRLVVGQTALGSGDQFGCVDCQDSGPESETVDAPQLLVVPVDGTPVSVRTEQVGAGQYAQVEVEVVSPDAAIRAANPSWAAGATIEVSGTYNGVAFTLPIAIEGSFRETLTPPVDVPAGAPAGSIQVTITLPVASWFTSNGTALDPADPAQRAQIVANAHASFQALESESGGREN
jgi:anti-sigma factor RsiW